MTDQWNANTIRDLRVRLGHPGRAWTQAQLADTLGVTRRTVQNWEAGETPQRANQRALDRLAAELDRAEHTPRTEPTPEQLRALVPKVLPYTTDAELTAEITRRFARSTPPTLHATLPGPKAGRWVWGDPSPTTAQEDESPQVNNE